MDSANLKSPLSNLKSNQWNNEFRLNTIEYKSLKQTGMNVFSGNMSNFYISITPLQIVDWQS